MAFMEALLVQSGYPVGIVPILTSESRRQFRPSVPTPSPRSGANSTAGRPYSLAMLAIVGRFYAEQVVGLQSSSKSAAGGPDESIARRVQVLCSPHAHCTFDQSRQLIAP